MNQYMFFIRVIYVVVKLGITVNLGILGYLKIDRVISRFPVGFANGTQTRLEAVFDQNKELLIHL